MMFKTTRVLLVCLVALSSSLGCEKKAPPTANTQAGSNTARAALGNETGPTSKKSEDVSEEDVELHLKVMQEMLGCAAKGKEVFFCQLTPGAMEKRQPGALPGEDEVQLGWTVFIPTQGEPEAAVLEPAPIALGIKSAGEDGHRAQVTPVLARNPENRDKIRGLGKQIGDILTGKQPVSEPVVVHDPQLLAYLRDQAARASYTIAPRGRGWHIQDKKHSQLYRLGDRWVSAHRTRPRPDKPDGIWFSIYTPAKMVGEIAPTKELDVAGLRATLGCEDSKNKEVCEGLAAFEGAAPIKDVLANVDTLQMYFGPVVGSGEEARRSHGAFLIRQGKGGAEVAFSHVVASNEEEGKSLEALERALAAGEDPGENRTLTYLKGITRHPSAFGEMSQSDGKSGLVARRGILGGSPDSRTISYFRRDGDRILVITHDHLGGKAWFWSLSKIPARE